MIVKLLTERHLEFLSLKGGCTGSSESTLVKMSKYIFLLKVGHIRVGGKDYVIEPTTNQATLVSDGTHVVYQIDNSQDIAEEFTDDTFTVDMGN